MSSKMVILALLLLNMGCATAHSPVRRSFSVQYDGSVNELYDEGEPAGMIETQPDASAPKSSMRRAAGPPEVDESLSEGSTDGEAAASAGQSTPVTTFWLTNNNRCVQSTNGDLSPTPVETCSSSTGCHMGSDATPSADGSSSISDLMDACATSNGKMGGAFTCVAVRMKGNECDGCTGLETYGSWYPKAYWAGTTHKIVADSNCQGLATPAPTPAPTPATPAPTPAPTPAAPFTKMAESGWCSAANGQEWRSTNFDYTDQGTTCTAKCASETSCIGFWQYVSPSQWAGTCTMFSTSADFSGPGFGTTYDRQSKSYATSSADFTLSPVANCECWTRV